MLRDFWLDFIGAVDDIKDLRVTQVLDALDDLLGAAYVPAARGRQRPRAMPAMRQPAQLSLKLGRFGAFIGCSNYPECNFTRQMTPGADGAQAARRCSARIQKPVSKSPLRWRPLRQLSAARRRDQGAK